MRRLIFFAVVPCLLAQAPVAAFDVASVKPAGGDFGRFSAKVTPTTLSYSNVTLAFCVERAYGLKTWQVIAPDWMKTELYGIEAKTSTAVPQEQMMAMLRTLLQDRFHLTSHESVKTMAVYVMGAEGDHHGLKPSQSAEGSPGTGYGPGAQEPWKRVLKFNRVTMPMLADMLNGGLVGSDLPVIDRTGIEGFFDFVLKFTTTAEQPPSRVEDGDVPVTVSKQLGISVKRMPMPIDVLVVDGGDRKPVEN